MARVFFWLLLLGATPQIITAQAPDNQTTTPARLAELLGSDADEGFARALAPRRFEFPADHGPHPRYRNEWWYFTGNLDGDDGGRYGFELTFFRFSLSPATPESESAWRTNQVYIAHLALTDADDERFYVAQRYSRGAVGLAGAQGEPFRVWLEDWQVAAVQGDSSWLLSAGDRDFAIEVTLEPLRSPVLNGDDGLSQKSSQAGNASYYYSITRLRTEGRLRIAEREYRVSGLSWLDREWSTSALADDQAGWDWFALQLSDGSDLMFYSLRRQDGSEDPASAGTWIAPNGEVSHLGSGDVEIAVLDRWPSPEGGVYPARWRLFAPRLSLDVTITPVMADQELFTTVRYWEGAVDAAGQRRGRPISGRGYVELTGYAEDITR